MADLSQFDPNSVGLKANNIFGLPFTEADAVLVLVPVPWEVTVSYRAGTADGPANIFDASLQVDLYDPDVTDGWKKGFYMQPVDTEMQNVSTALRNAAEQIIASLEEGDEEASIELHDQLAEINNECTQLIEQVRTTTGNLMRSGKKVGLIGGDHSTPLGYIKALSDIHSDFGILQIDAHADLRNAYEGFTYSHASIMYNVLKEVPQVSKLVQVGIRDYCDEELQVIQNSNGRVTTFFDKNIKERQYEGETWKQICLDIVTVLPQKVYISFDIDGLDPKLCPNTGTPVPGGFEMEQVFYLFKLLHASGRELIGFDLNEVSTGGYGDSMDSITGARVLYKMCNYMVA
ncbi:MAG: agmatinase family protein [Flavipsychrobacter sp.]|nr:agmatinase family protein [Flavipsychrobacter sp.]